MNQGFIGLLTDFGSTWTYVAQMKAVIWGSLPECHILDITHHIPCQSILHGELALRSVLVALPPGSALVAVVDPGVGTARRGIAIHACQRYFVGPDNGLLSQAAALPGARAVELSAVHLHRQPTSHTFHGRDVFAPVAVELAAGVDFHEVGTPIELPELLPSTMPRMTKAAQEVLGQGLVADNFGNILTNIPAGAVPWSWSIEVDGQRLPRVRTYGDGPRDGPMILAGSDGYLEIAWQNGSAAQRLGTIECQVRCLNKKRGE